MRVTFTCLVCALESRKDISSVSEAMRMVRTNACAKCGGKLQMGLDGQREELVARKGLSLLKTLHSREEITVQPAWDSIYDGNVFVEAEGWRFCFLKRDGELASLESITDPDGNFVTSAMFRDCLMAKFLPEKDRETNQALARITKP